jgi:hypothetical protein
MESHLKRDKGMRIMSCYSFPFWLSCLFWPDLVSYFSFHVLPVLSLLSCPGCPTATWLSGPGCLVLAVSSRLSCSTVLSWQYCQAVMSLLRCPGCPDRLSCPRCPLRAVLSQLSCHSCPARLSCHGSPITAILSWISWLNYTTFSRGCPCCSVLSCHVLDVLSSLFCPR